MREIDYNRKLVVEYAKKWAYGRNPAYYNFDPVGGDCTNFVSQCIYAGSKTMNYNKNNGWYYNNGNDKSPSWSGVEFLHRFIISNKGVGPYGKEVQIEDLQVGDIAQLSFASNVFGHTLMIVGDENIQTIKDIYVATHTFDSFYRSITTYQYEKIRFVHIEGVRVW